MQQHIGNDVTDFARSLGYHATKRVFVLNGRVVSHRNADWFAFCNRLRRLSRPKASPQQSHEEHVLNTGGGLEISGHTRFVFGVGSWPSAGFLCSRFPMQLISRTTIKCPPATNPRGT